MEKQVNPLILILCTGNSCRSHMAEGILREVAGNVLNVQSAGSAPTGSVHPLAILTLGEIGIDISSHTSKHMNEFLSANVETVITVCDNADQVCPSFPGQSYRHHWPFPDPAKAEGTEAEIRNIFEQVRDDIRRVFTDYGLSRIKSIQGLPS
jgi:arsenate reductase